MGRPHFRKVRLKAGEHARNGYHAVHPEHAYFLCDEPMSVAALRERLIAASPDECIRLLAKILREARDTKGGTSH